MSNKVLITNDQNVVKVPSGLRILIRRSCNAVLDFEHFDGPAEISVTFVDNNRIHELNKEYRNKDSATDVLSFPLGENGEYDIDEDNGCKLLGDIVISMERAMEQAAIEAAYKEGEAKLKGNGKSVPALSVLKTPLRDGDAERPDDEAYKNAYFVNANATSAPGIVDADLNPILTRSEVYSGVYGRASITFYAFNSSGNKGIACGLNNLQKIRDGEPLGGKASAESDFATDDDEDFLN